MATSIPASSSSGILIVLYVTVLPRDKVTPRVMKSLFRGQTPRSLLRLGNPALTYYSTLTPQSNIASQYSWSNVPYDADEIILPLTTSERQKNAHAHARAAHPFTSAELFPRHVNFGFECERWPARTRRPVSLFTPSQRVIFHFSSPSFRARAFAVVQGS